MRDILALILFIVVIMNFEKILAIGSRLFDIVMEMVGA